MTLFIGFWVIQSCRDIWRMKHEVKLPETMSKYIRAIPMKKKPGCQSPHAESTACTLAVSLMRTWSCAHCYRHGHQRPSVRMLSPLGCCVASSQVKVYREGIWLVEPRSYDFAWLQRSLGRWASDILGTSKGRKPLPSTKTHKVEL